METTKVPGFLESADWTKVVNRAITNLKFGVVQIVVHDGKVVQIETTEKVRFNQGDKP